MLKIGLDLRATEADFKQHAMRGTGRYVREISKALTQNNSFEIVGLYSKDFSNAISNNLPMLGRRTIESQFLLPRRLKNKGLDLAHFFSHGDAPAWGGLPTVVTVLDLIPLIFPSLYSAGKSNLRFKFARFLENQAARSAKGILAISEATKRDLVKILNVNPDKIFVTPLAVTQDFALKAGELEQKKEFRSYFKFNSEQPLLLYVGGIDARKNITFLIEVLGELVKAYSWQLPPKLLLAGSIKNDDKYPRLKEKIKELKLQDHVQELGFVSDQDLLKLYVASDVFIFPSLYEGFGLPVLEAMNRSTPVVAANNSSIPEVVGANYPLCADNDLQAWVKQIYSILNDSELRQKLSSIGLEQATKFSWQKTSAKTIEAYSKILKQ
jgi:glycosyltransferase involved in cell wall biosynthesis